MADITDSRHGDIFTFISPTTEKLEKQDKFQLRDKSEAEPLKDGFAASIVISKRLLFCYASC